MTNNKDFAEHFVESKTDYSLSHNNLNHLLFLDSYETEKVKRKNKSKQTSVGSTSQNCNHRIFDTCFGKHGRQQFAHYGSPLPHLALFAIRKIRDDSDNVFGAGGLECIGHD